MTTVSTPYRHIISIVQEEKEDILSLPGLQLTLLVVDTATEQANKFFIHSIPLSPKDRMFMDVLSCVSIKR